jgi:hypothetical protein
MEEKKNSYDADNERKRKMTENLFQLFEAFANTRILLKLSNKEKLDRFDDCFKNAESELYNIFSREIDPNLQNNEGSTLLHVAVFSDSESFVRFLMEEGANPNIGNSKGQTPLDFAECLPTIRDIIINYSAQRDQGSSASLPSPSTSQDHLQENLV